MIAGDQLRVLWHDIECGGYQEDLPLWRELAQRRGGPVLDVGCGTGRVTLDLAAHGVAVVALDRDDALLEALAQRAHGLPVELAPADATTFSLARRFPLVIVPMQTVQLLRSRGERAAFLERAVTHLLPGGLLAMALADALESFDAETDGLPIPDMREIDGWVFASRPLAVIDEGGAAAIHRLREIVAPDGTRTTADDVVRLARIDAEQLAVECVHAGLAALAPRAIPATHEYVGSLVVQAEAPR